jgi:hypothetical protein
VKYEILVVLSKNPVPFALGVGSYLHTALTDVQRFCYRDLHALLTNSLPSVVDKLGITPA